MIDTRGGLYAVGRIDSPPDARGPVPSLEANLVRIRFSDVRSMELTACHARRDPSTGYLAVDLEGPTLHVPSEIGTIVADMLRFGDQRNPIDLELDIAGALSLSADGEQTSREVSRWQGRIRPIEGDVVEVALSAALSPLPVRVDGAATEPRRRDPSASRVAALFTMDPVTRVVGLGAHSNELPLQWGSGTTEVGTLAHMRLESTPIGSTGDLWGYSDDGRVVKLSEWRSRLQMTLHAPQEARRSVAGLIANNSAFPRLTFVGVDLGVAAHAMWSSPAFGVTLSRGEIGSFCRFRGRDTWEENQRLTEAHLGFELTHAGLHLTYTADLDGGERLAGRVTFPWEWLILRSPLFILHADALLR